MSEIGVRGIDLFKIAGESISGWIPSWKTGEARPTRQPFCCQMEEQLLLYLEYHPQVAWYGRGDISSTFASTYKITTPLPTPYTIDYLFEGKAHVYLPDAIGQLLDGRFLIAEAGLEQDKRRERVDRAVARLPKGTEGYAIDLSNEEHVRDFFNHLGAFDHLVFTAGEMLQLSEVSETNVEQARHVFDLRFWGAFMAAKYGSSQIRPGGSIVLSSGVVGRRPRKGGTVGAGISGAVEALTRALAVELAPIRVNAVCPGPVRTELWMSMSEEVREARFRSIGQALPVGRVGEAHDLAQAYLYMMHEGFSTGQVIIVDGGTTLV